jgi:hypothetical protein
MNTLVDIKNKKRKYNRKFESESNPITKDEKFNRLLETTRERVTRDRELEQHLQQYNTQQKQL